MYDRLSAIRSEMHSMSGVARSLNFQYDGPRFEAMGIDVELISNESGKRVESKVDVNGDDGGN